MAGERIELPIADICHVKQGRYLAPGEMAGVRTPATPVPVYGANGILGYTDQVMFSEPVSLVTCRGNGCGLLQRTEGRAWISNNAMACPPKGNNDSRYLHYLLFASDFDDVTTGSAQPQITAGHLNAKTILLATDQAEQKAIAAVLGALDDKIEVNRRMNATLEAMARALFRSWFVDFDPVRAKLDGRKPIGMDAATAALFPEHFDHKAEGVVPTDWNLKRWGDIATLEYGKSIRDYRENSGKYRVWGTNGPIGFHEEALCNSAGIVIGRKGAYRGVHYSPEPFFVIDTAFYLKPKAPLDLKWAYYELLRFDINSMDSGSAIPSTSRDDFYGIPVIVPPPEIQAAFGKIVSGWFAKVFTNDHESRTLGTLRDTLLPKLLSGELSLANAPKHSPNGP